MVLARACGGWQGVPGSVGGANGGNNVGDKTCELWWWVGVGGVSGLGR